MNTKQPDSWRDRFMDQFAEHLKTPLQDSWCFKWGEGTDPRLIADWIEQERIKAQIEVLEELIKYYESFGTAGMAQHYLPIAIKAELKKLQQ